MNALVSRICLAATPTAVSCSRIFTAHTLRRWNVPSLVENAELVVSELVTNAVKATGVLAAEPAWEESAEFQLLHVSIYGHVHGRSLTLQVWDASEEPPLQSEGDLDVWSESGRGLAIVEALALHAGYFYPKAGGKVVWAECALNGVTQRLPRRLNGEPTNIVMRRPDPELLLKVLKGLQ
ncbi:ATP-binding protein [Streptomyces sp. NPDC127033]|uniref:ATP-binding protein n=1 Tax=Streptomyces sp. NPDC127033 TaxID=3347110 RepID=UPI00366186E4